MCGITGVMRFAGDAQIDAAILRRMCAAMVHRGPDDEGIYAEGRIGLGVRRLSIVDLTTGHQPISNEDGTVWIVFNGEIYNHIVLREQLVARGHRYRTCTDTETVVHLYEEYGQNCVEHLRGMFAFAIWDARHQLLFVVRDRLGIKPLYYRLTAESFVFGSEIKVILACPGITPEFNRDILPEYLALGYLSGPETFYAGIHKLMPGHTLDVRLDGKATIRQYWDVPQAQNEPDRPEKYYVQGYRDLLEQAVGSHLMSDVPLGVLLSGGLDSSAVAALTTKISGRPIETFSVGYTEQPYSELPYAWQVAERLNSVHHEVLVSRDDFFSALPKLIWHEDEPMVWPSSVALYFVAKLAHERVKVVLTGEGSDETLAGYTRYAFTLGNAAFDRVYRGLIPKTLRRGIRQAIARSSLLGATLRRRLEHTFLFRDGDRWDSFYFDNFLSAFSADEQKELLTDQLQREVCEGAAYCNVLDCWEHSSGDVLQRLLFTDIKTYLVELLMKQDNMSMAVSVESRVPFLDHELVEFAARIPRRFQIKGLSGKWVLKKAVADLLPGSIIHRPKLGFPTPWASWLEGPQLDVIQKLLLEPRSVQRAMFQPSEVGRLFQEHRAHHRDHSDRIWRLLNLELWFRVCLEGDSHDFGPGWN